jgi:transcription antitermination factor NusG
MIGDAKFLQSSLNVHVDGSQRLEREWFAVFTIPQTEQSVIRHLDAFQLGSFLPTFETTRVWKNRQTKKIVRPLFPTYVFVHVTRSERRFVYGVPGVLRIVGGASGPIPIPEAEMDVLRSDELRGRLEPFRDLVTGDRVRIRAGSLQGVEGILVRRKNSFRLVLSVGLISQHASVEIGVDEVEAVN